MLLILEVILPCDPGRTCFPFGALLSGVALPGTVRGILTSQRRKMEMDIVVRKDQRGKKDRERD